MGIATTPRTYFVKSLIRNGNFQRARLVRNRQKQATSKRFGDINVQANPGKFALGTIKCNVIHFDKMTHVLEQLP